MGKYGLIRKSGNHAIAIDAGDILRRENENHARMSRDELIEIAQLKARPVMRAANHAHAQRTSGSFIRAENLRAVDFLLAIEPYQARTHRCACGGRRSLRDAPAPASIIALIIFRYPVQRQSTPPIASITSLSLGDGFFSSRAVAATSIPGVHAPHCAAPCERNDCCNRPCSGDRSPALHRRDLTSRNLTRSDQASANRIAIQQHRAGAAVARVASHFRSRQSKIVAQHAGEPPRSGRRHLDRASVHRERNQLGVRRGNFSVVAISGSPRRLRARVAPESTTHRAGSRRWRARHQSEKETKMLGFHAAPIPVSPASPPDPFPNRAAAALSPNRIPPRRVPRPRGRVIRLHDRRHHRNGNHQISPRAQLQKCRSRIFHAPRNQHRRQNFVRAPQVLRLPARTAPAACGAFPPPTPVPPLHPARAAAAHHPPPETHCTSSPPPCRGSESAPIPLPSPPP